MDSNIQNINIGVPQGSYLGPLQFLICIYALANSVKIVKVSMYADDTSLVAQSENISQLTEALNDEFNFLIQE